jgi:sentrin-specific protease 1
MYIQRKEIVYYDSMSGSGSQCKERLLRYLCDESMDKKKVRLDPSEWNITAVMKNVPQQRNMIDCGVFTCAFADYVCADKVSQDP